MASLKDLVVIIFTKNEELNILPCLESLEPFPNIVVLDSLSTDQTCNLARSKNATVATFDWNGAYPKKRQWSLGNVRLECEWVLFIDADERVTIDFAKEVESLLAENPEIAGGVAKLDYVFSGRRLRHGIKPRKVVLLNRLKMRYPEVDDLDAKGMGELEGHYQPHHEGSIYKFKSFLIHDDHDPIETWILRHVRYANWEAHILLNSHAKSVVDSAKSGNSGYFHRLPMKSFIFFFYSYFFKFGFLDGRAGFDYAFGKAWYYWLSGVIARENNGHDK